MKSEILIIRLYYLYLFFFSQMKTLKLLIQKCFHSTPRTANGMLENTRIFEAVVFFVLPKIKSNFTSLLEHFFVNYGDEFIFCVDTRK